jgi:serine/threonine-protein kinase
VAEDVAAGLAHAHERGLVHRDLKPANILFDAEGRAKIADFGIARMRGTGTLTEAGTVLGTASYLSPEQAAGQPAGPQSDVYSFGVILFRMLTGRLPFESSNAMELVRMHRDDLPPAVRDVRPDAPAALAALAADTLAKDPSARPADGSALLQLLGDTGTAATQVLPSPSPRPRRRRLVSVLLVALLLLLAGGALALTLTRGRGNTARTTTTTEPPLSLPSVPTAGSTPLPPPVTTAPPTTAEQTTTEAETTTAPPTTTAPETTTAETTTAPSVTTAQETTTAPATTAPVTTLETTTAVTTSP